MKSAKSVAAWLIGILLSSIVTALITGQPLTGFLRLKGLYKTFVQSRVPAWSFALVFLIAIVGLYYAFANWPKGLPKGKLHFMPDAYNCGWSRQSDTEMNVSIGGTFTYEAHSDLIVFQAFLKGTKPNTDLMPQVEASDGSGRMITVSDLWLRSLLAHKVYIHMHLTPIVGEVGKPLRRKLILRDKYLRDFEVGPIEFRFAGAK